MYYYDYHIHTTNSRDGKSSLNDICRSAISKGIQEIAITDHFEPTEKDQEYLLYQPELFLKQIEEARQIFKGILTIKYGIELGQPHIYPTYSEKVIQEYPFDFVLASAHKMVGDIDFGDIDYNRADHHHYMKKYLNELTELVQWGQFDCIAHFDLIKRYFARAGFKINLLDQYGEKVSKILKSIIAQGKGIEINTSGLRQYSAGLMPDWDILSLYKELGGVNITIGSDAHYAADVGKGIGEAMQLLSTLNFHQVTLYEKRKPYYMTLGKSSHRSA